MGILKMLRNMGNPEGTRETIRISYKKHARMAIDRGAPPDLGSPHSIGLYGALASRYMARGEPMPEPAVWVELTPFLLMAPSVSVEALAEYIVSQEHGFEKAKTIWLRELINEALRKPPQTEESPRIAAAFAKINGVAWLEFLDQDVMITLNREADELREKLNG